MSNVLFMVLVYNVIVIGGIGWNLNWKEKQTNQVTDMALGGRDAGIAMFSVTMAITYLGSAHVYGLMELSFIFGAVALWFCFAHSILLCIICLGTGRWIRRVGCATIPEFLGTLYGEKIRILTAGITVMVVFGILTLETQALGISLTSMSDWSLGWCVVLGMIIGTAYVTMGGIKQTMWVNLVNAVVMYGSVIIAGIYLTFVLPGGWEAVTQHYINTGEEFKLSIFATSDIFLGFGVATIFAVVFSQSVNQQGMQAAMSAKNEKTIRRSIWVAAPINGMFGVFPVLVGLAAATIPEFAELGPKLAGPTLIVKLLPTWLVVILQAGFLGALLSTFAMTALAPATIVVKDLIGSNVKGGLNARQEKSLIRGVIIGMCALSAGITFFLQPSIVAGITWLFAWLVPFFFIIIAGLFWKRNTAIAQTVVLVSWVANLAWSFTDIKNILGLSVLQNSHITAIVALFMTVIGYSLAKTAKPAYFKKQNIQIHLEGRNA